VKDRESLVRALIYPVPDPAFPFLGVHFTRMVKGGVEAGPNAVLSFKREGYRKTDFDLREAWDTFSYPGFWKLAASTGAPAPASSIARSARRRSCMRCSACCPICAWTICTRRRRRARAGDRSRRRAGGRLLDPGAGRRRPRAERAVARRHGVAADRRGDRRRGAPALRLD
jgi:hypothetical protein